LGRLGRGAPEATRAGGPVLPDVAIRTDHLARKHTQLLGPYNRHGALFGRGARLQHLRDQRDQVL
jgi:hypothetical protein